MGQPVVHFEIGCQDQGRTARFFTDLFGWAVTQAGSASVKMTACAVNPITPASRGAGGGTKVTSPFAGGNQPAATSSRRTASGPRPG